MAYDAVDLMFRKPFKIRYKGQRLMVRPQHEGELIQPKSLQCYGTFTDYDGRHKWEPSTAVGEQVDSKNNRRYILVLSPYYQGESVTFEELMY